MSDSIIVRKLGRLNYESTWRAMQTFTSHRQPETPDEIWTLEHFPIYTLGQNSKPEHILNLGNIPVIQTDRGGQITYHGPGQLIIYPLINLNQKKLNVRQIVTLLEQAVIAVLALYHIDAEAKREAPGVYVQGKKIASIGLRIRKGCSYHGVAININMDLSPFLGINPCGFANLPMAQFVDFVPNFTMKSLTAQFVDWIISQLGYTNVSYATSLPQPI